MAVTTQLANTQRHIFYFLTMFFPSWHHIASESNRKGGSCEVDLVVFCERAECEAISHLCVDLKGGAALAEASTTACTCFYAETKQTQESYRFMHSIRFLASAQFSAIVDSGRYGWVMRVDTDTFLLPGILTWRPQTPGLIAGGKGYMGQEYTFRRLERVARELGLRHKKVHGMQSTVVLHSSIAKRAFAQFVNLTEYFYEHEFTEEKCSAEYTSKDATLVSSLDASGLKDTALGSIKYAGACSWPYWHRGVVSLYAQDVVLNSLEPADCNDAASCRVPGALIPQATRQLDSFFHMPGQGSGEEDSMLDVSSVHIISEKHTILKTFTQVSKDGTCKKKFNEQYPIRGELWACLAICESRARAVFA